MWLCFALGVSSSASPLTAEELEQGQQATPQEGIGPSRSLEAAPVALSASEEWEAPIVLDPVPAVIVDLSESLASALTPADLSAPGLYVFREGDARISPLPPRCFRSRALGSKGRHHAREEIRLSDGSFGSGAWTHGGKGESSKGKAAFRPAACKPTSCYDGLDDGPDQSLGCPYESTRASGAAAYFSARIACHQSDCRTPATATELCFLLSSLCRKAWQTP